MATLSRVCGVGSGEGETECFPEAARNRDIRLERVKGSYTVWRARFAVTAPYTEDLWPVYVVPYAEERR